jgi:hypothetical protein
MSFASRTVIGMVAPLLGVAVMSGCGTATAPADQSSAAVFHRAFSAPVRHVTLAGKLDLSAFGLPDETYAMHARRDADGGVRGQIEVHLSDPLVDLHGDVTCLQVDGSLAWVGVQVTRSDATDGPFAEGGSFWFRVEDNGEGANALPDRISFLNPAGGAARCNEKRTGLPLAFTMQGNVQIR